MVTLNYDGKRFSVAEQSSRPHETYSVDNFYCVFGIEVKNRLGISQKQDMITLSEDVIATLCENDEFRNNIAKSFEYIISVKNKYASQFPEDKFYDTTSDKIILSWFNKQIKIRNGG